ncbi:MAG: 50S ribosomal protein L33 2 [Candidatus Hepatoplasma vulgare]|nr:MAG: 50S ribosomal protein L33 2 [Candidatus Hepatoplasma sp.]
MLNFLYNVFIVNKKNKVTIACEICFSRNYLKNKTDSLSNEKLVLKKYCSKCNANTIHHEVK